MGFSKASRWRLLKMLATIHWEHAKKCLFITLTFPDERKVTSTRQSNQARFLFLRYAENFLGKKVSAIWRMEWKPRLSGAFVGELFPHFHIMLFGVSYIAHKTVNEWWAKSLGWQGYVRTEVKAMANEKQAGSYVAKYCAKIEDGSLVNAAYLNNRPTGREWGIHRKNLLPRCEEKVIRIASNEVTKECRKLAENEWPDIKQFRESFSLLGPLAVVVAAKLFPENFVDSQTTVQ